MNDPVVFPGVTLGDGVDLQSPCVVGQPPDGRRPGELETDIGAGSLVRAFTVIYAGVVMGREVRTGHGTGAGDGVPVQERPPAPCRGRADEVSCRARA